MRCCAWELSMNFPGNDDRTRYRREGDSGRGRTRGGGGGGGGGVQMNGRAFYHYTSAYHGILCSPDKCPGFSYHSEVEGSRCCGWELSMDC